MCKVVPKEGPCAPLFYSGILFLLAAGVSSAQDVQQSDLEHCAGLATAELKLACFESLTTTGDEKTAPAAIESEPVQELHEAPVAPQESVVEESVSPPAELLPESAAAEPDTVSVVEPAADVADSQSIEPAVGQDAVPPPSTSGEVSVGGAAVPAAASAAPESPPPSTQAVDATEAGQAGIPDEFGSEHLGVPEDDEADTLSVNAIVVDVEKGRNKVLYFTFENGQVWRQLEGRRFSYPRNDTFEVVISTGLMGDYRLRLAKGGPMTRIRRIK